MQVNSGNWSDVLSRSSPNLKEEALFYNTDSKVYVVADRKMTDANMRKLSFHEIINHAEAMENSKNCDYVALKNMVKVLDQMTIRAEQKYFFLRFNRALKMTFNFSFSTTTEKVRGLSSRLSLKQAQLSEKKLEDFEIKTYTKDQKAERKASLAFEKKASKFKNDNKAEHRVKLGKGAHGTVFNAENNRVIKKICSDKPKILDLEYRIGAKLDHPNLVKSHSLHQSDYDKSVNKGLKNNYLVMDKIDGQMLAKIKDTSVPLTNEVVLKNLDQAKDCCLYLFDENIAWADVNAENIFIDTQDNLKICDFGAWSLETDSKVRALKLLLGSLELTGRLFNATDTDIGRQRVILYPVEFFKEHSSGPTTQVFSEGAFKDYKDGQSPWLTAIAKKLEPMNNQEIKEFLADYFDQVKAKFNEKISTQTQ